MRPRIPGMTLVAERPHDKYGSAIFIRDDLKVKSLSATAVNHVEVIRVELSDVVVHSVYKSPNEQFVLPPLGHRNLPQIVIDFNSNNTIWGYDDTDNNIGITGTTHTLFGRPYMVYPTEHHHTH